MVYKKLRKCQRCKKKFRRHPITKCEIDRPITGCIGGVEIVLCYSCGVDVYMYIKGEDE